MAQNKGGFGKVSDVSGEVNIASGNVINVYTAQQVTALLVQIPSSFQPRLFDVRYPYKGLDVFKEDDAELFFGREILIDDIVSCVKQSRMVFITDPLSG